MKFDIVIGNPPYQSQIAENRFMPIYCDFILRACELSKRYVNMITPARWYNAFGSTSTAKVSKLMLSSGCLTDLVNYPYNIEVFDNVDLACNICYFNLDLKKTRGNEYIINYTNVADGITVRREVGNLDMFISDNKAYEIITKILKKSNPEYTMEQFMVKVNSYSPETNAIGTKERVYEDDIAVIGKAQERFYIRRTDTDIPSDYLTAYKAYLSRLSGDMLGHNGTKDYNLKVIGVIEVAKENEIPTKTYHIGYVSHDYDEVMRYVSYMRTRLVRFIVASSLSAIHIYTPAYRYVPMQDFSEEWTDEKLYAKYELTQDEIDYIEYKVREYE